MLKLTLGQAAKETGKSKATISRAIASGKLSAHKNDNKGYDIDPAELFRVYPYSNTTQPLNETPAGKTVSTLLVENNALKEQVERLDDEQERNCRLYEVTIEDLRKRLDEAERERREKDRTLTALLTDQRDRSGEVEKLKADLEAEKGRGWWSRVFGR